MKTDVIISKKATIGIPVISKSYKNKTPKTIKIIGDSLIFAGGLISTITALSTPPAWVGIVVGVSTLTGRFVLKCIGEKTE